MTYTDNTLFEIPLIQSVVVYDETSSTNDKAKELIKKGAIHGTLVLADMQSAGKGRLGRSFSSPSGCGIYMSLILTPEMSPEHFSMLTLIAGMAVLYAIDEIPGVNAGIKWPNDITAGKKKLSGILTETVLRSGNEIALSLKENEFGSMSDLSTARYARDGNSVIIGIGINVNNGSFPEELSHAGSLYQITGVPVDRGRLVKNVLSHFSELYDSFCKSKNLSFLMEAYNNRLSHRNREIFVIPFERTQTAKSAESADTEGLTPYVCMGINEKGELLCKRNDGSLFSIKSGEVSVREA